MIPPSATPISPFLSTPLQEAWRAFRQPLSLNIFPKSLERLHLFIFCTSSLLEQQQRPYQQQEQLQQTRPSSYPASFNRVFPACLPACLDDIPLRLATGDEAKVSRHVSEQAARDQGNTWVSQTDITGQPKC